MGPWHTPSPGIPRHLPFSGARLEPAGGRRQTGSMTDRVVGAGERDGAAPPDHPAEGQLRALALTNYGHFTTLRVEGGRVRGLSLHLERLVRDCRAVFGAGLDPDAVRDRVRSAVRGRTDPVMVRITVADPAFSLTEPALPAAPRLLLTVRPVPPPDQAPLRLRAAVFRRELPEVKHTGLFGSLHARREAQLAGCDDALFTDPAGLVSEGPTWNIGFWDGRRLVRPAAEALPGVTMALLHRVRPFAEEPVPLAALGGFRAAFAASSGFGVRPVASVSGAGYRADFAVDDPVLAELRRGYAADPGEPLE